jgi:hypothetical protein
VHDLRTYDYAIVRVVPRVERGEFVNAGIILSCDVERTLLACIELDEAALLALAARMQALSPSYRCASDFIGWSRREAPSCRLPRCMRANAAIFRRRSSI